MIRTPSRARIVAVVIAKAADHRCNGAANSHGSTARRDEETRTMHLESDLLNMFADMAGDPTTPEPVLRAAVLALTQFAAHAQYAEHDNSRAALRFAVRTIVAPAAARHGLPAPDQRAA